MESLFHTESMVVIEVLRKSELHFSVPGTNHCPNDNTAIRVFQVAVVMTTSCSAVLRSTGRLESD
jgi:hypothetical protein